MIPATLNIDTRCQELFWSKLTLLKFDLSDLQIPLVTLV